MNQEELAKEFAITAHGNQKYGDQPYIVHLEAVNKIITKFNLDYLLVASWLHDIIEDTDTTKETIENKFGKEVFNLVWAVSGEGKNRKERNASVYLKLKQLPKAVNLKLADRIANCQSSKQYNQKLFQMYQKEYPTFKAQLQEFGNKDMWDMLDQILLTK